MPLDEEHPRARGENQSGAMSGSRLSGTSPRTRGKQRFERWWIELARNIPAHAGKTSYTVGAGSAPTEHPRARGENPPLGAYRTTNPGTSPRTRGKPVSDYVDEPELRNIPAHAGKTRCINCTGQRVKEHPRARGENGAVLPPPTKCDRNIPAHAGKTRRCLWTRQQWPEHPRARGENG